MGLRLYLGDAACAARTLKSRSASENQGQNKRPCPVLGLHFARGTTTIACKHRVDLRPRVGVICAHEETPHYMIVYGKETPRGDGACTVLYCDCEVALRRNQRTKIYAGTTATRLSSGPSSRPRRVQRRTRRDMDERCEVRRWSLATRDLLICRAASALPKVACARTPCIRE